MAAISTTDTAAAERKIKTAFRAFTGKRKLDEYQFDFEHDGWFVTHKPTGDTWSVHDTDDSVGFERL